MPQIRFNKNIEGLEDCTAHDIPQEGFSHIILIKAAFDEGYSNSAQMVLTNEKGLKSIPFTLFKSLHDNPKSRIINLKGELYFDSEKIHLQIKANLKFDFTVDFEYCIKN